MLRQGHIQSKYLAFVYVVYVVMCMCISNSRKEHRFCARCPMAKNTPAHQEVPGNMYLAQAYASR